MSAAKKKRGPGRPRKERQFRWVDAEMVGDWRTPFQNFEALSDKEIRSSLLKEIKKNFSDCREFKEGHVVWAALPHHKDLERYMTAALKKIEDGDGMRAAYYLSWAVSCMQDNMASALAIPAQLGLERLSTRIKQVEQSKRAAKRRKRAA